MHEVNETEIVPYTPQQMFELVADVERYQEFLSWCEKSRVVSRKNNTVVVEFRVSLGPTTIFFTTQNEFHLPDGIDIQLLEGPFEVFEGAWRFSSEPRGGCKIKFRLRFRFAHEHLDFIFDPFLQQTTHTVINTFKDRAQTIYG